MTDEEQRAGVPESTHLHHVRHCSGSVPIHGGESVTVIQERLGHAGAVDTLKTDTHLWPSSEERTRSVVEAAWRGAIGDSVRTDGAPRAAEQRG